MTMTLLSTQNEEVKPADIDVRFSVWVSVSEFVSVPICELHRVFLGHILVSHPVKVARLDLIQLPLHTLLAGVQSGLLINPFLICWHFTAKEQFKKDVFYRHRIICPPAKSIDLNKCKLKKCDSGQTWSPCAGWSGGCGPAHSSKTANNRLALIKTILFTAPSHVMKNYSLNFCL